MTAMSTLIGRGVHHRRPGRCCEPALGSRPGNQFFPAGADGRDVPSSFQLEARPYRASGCAGVTPEAVRGRAGAILEAWSRADLAHGSKADDPLSRPSEKHIKIVAGDFRHSDRLVAGR